MGVPGGCKYFSERAAPQVGADGSKVHNKKNFDPLGHPKPKIGPFESTKKGDIIPPVVKRGSSFNCLLYATAKSAKIVDFNGSFTPPHQNF